MIYGQKPEEDTRTLPDTFPPESLATDIDITLVRVERQAPVVHHKPGQQENIGQKDSLNSESRPQPRKCGYNLNGLSQIVDNHVVDFDHFGHGIGFAASYKFPRLLKALRRYTSSLLRGGKQSGASANRAGETAAIFTSHGVLDAATTILAARAVGPDAEANPIVRELLAMGELPAAVAMLAVVGLCCGAWPIAADALEAPEWVGLGIATVGAAVAAVNLVVVFA